MSNNLSPIEQLQETLDLLRIEQEEDRKQYREKVLQSPLAERKKLGVTWYPISIKEQYYGIGERLILEIERPQGGADHQFQFGSVAALFSNLYNEGVENPHIAGVVTSVRSNQLRLTLFIDELPEWAYEGKLGLDMMFDETSYKEMEHALQTVMKARNNRQAQLREILLGNQTPAFQKLLPYHSERLNGSQNKAISLLTAAKDIAIIHGPPGTGKTTTLITFIQETLKTEQQILVCAPSNAAVDLLTELVAESGIGVIRIGNPSRVSETLLHHTIDYKISSHPQYKQIKDFRRRAAEFRSMGAKYKRNFGKEEREQRRAIFNEAKKLQIEAENIENFITEDSINKASVITATLVGSSGYLLKDRKFTTVIIDEAGQAMEPACWIPILRADRVIMAGDHFQLPPTIKSIEAAKRGLSVTLMEKAMGVEHITQMLDMQYRMNEMIMNFSSREFYKNQLKADPSVKDDTFTDVNGVALLPVEFIDTAGSGFQEQYEKESLSAYNPEEAQLLMKRLTILLNEISSRNVSVGIISPYKAQINVLREMANQQTFIDGELKISVNTVDGFQGQERDIICISLVRSNDRGEIGFLSDTRRMNVAMTRAKRKLIIIGDSGTLTRHPFYERLQKYIDEIGAYRSAWELLYGE